eukprot:457831-Prymnesium_polylepis.1
MARVARRAAAQQVRRLHPHQLHQLCHRRPDLRTEVGPRASRVAEVDLQRAQGAVRQPPLARRQPLH